MKLSQRLFPRIAVPIVLMGASLVLVTLVTASVLQVQLHKNELSGKAQLVAATLENSAQIFGSAAELIEYVFSLGTDIAGLQEVALIDNRYGRVAAATDISWINRPAHKVPRLHAVLKGLDEPPGEHGFAIPVVMDNPSLADDVEADSPVTKNRGGQFLAVIIFDDAGFTSDYEDAAAILLGVVGLGSLIVFLGTFFVIRQQVLKPVTQINRAILARRDDHAPLDLPKLVPDEIGQLGSILDRALLRISESDEMMSVMHSAIESSSNEVYVLQRDSLRFVNANKAALDNLGYTLEEITGMTAGQVAPDLLDEQLLLELAGQLDLNNEISHTYEHKRKDGSRYLFEFKGMLVQGRSSSVMITLGSDISERRAQEEALRVSEERMALALEGSNDGLFDYHIGTSQIFLSEFVRQWLGVPSEQLDINEFLDEIEAADKDRVQRAMQRAIEQRIDFNVEFRLRRTAQGQQRWLQVRGQVQFEDGVAQRLSGFVSDISRRKVAENLLHTTVTRLGAVLDHIADGILTLTDDGQVCTVNPPALAMFGLSKTELAGSMLQARLQLSDGGDFPFWEDIADGQVREILAGRGDGSEFVGEIAVTRMDLVSDERYTVVLRDISDRKDHELELRTAMLEAQAATQAKGEFLATMSHEIRTPMNGVLGMTQLLLDMDLTPAQRETAELIFSSGDSLLTLINDILDFSKIEAGKLELEYLPFDMRLAVKDVMELLSASARRKSLDLYVDYPEDMPFAFSGDVGRLRQVLLNLVGNAVKFTERGHVLVSVQAGSPADGQVAVRISVQDTGPGVAAEDQQRLFESFTQADTSITRKFGGTGLGLAISKQLVALMGGRIGINSSPGQGAEFWIEVSLPRCELEPGRGTPDFSRLQGYRMLAVDDNETGLQIVRRMAESFGMETVVTHLPEDVPALLEDAHRSGRAFDIVVLDYHMPGVDGLTLAADMRADARNNHSRIVLLTSSDLQAPAAVDGYALKPVMRFGFARLLLRALFDEQDSEAVPAAIVPRHPQANIRVLLAEDNPVNQRVAVKMLEKIGCRVDVAANGREALEMWQQFPYSLIFMDCQMPELDGLSATARIREMERDSGGGHVPIIAMTANAMARDREECLAAGMDDYASKPIKIGLLNELVDRWGTATGSPLP